MALVTFVRSSNGDGQRWRSQSHPWEFPRVGRKVPPMRVLVVEDEALLRWSITETLLQKGHEVVEAADGAGAIQRLQANEHVDVILLDYRLPDSNDLVLLANVRRLLPH